MRRPGTSSSTRATSENANGETAIFVPEFEVARAQAEASFDRADSYPEYPGLI